MVAAGMARGSGCCVAPAAVQERAATLVPAVPRAARAVAFRWCGIPGGTFWMGSDVRDGFGGDGEAPARQVRLSPFRISAFAVTNAQFADFVRATGYSTEAERLNWSYVFHTFVAAEVRARIPRVPADTPWWLPVPRAYWAQPEGPGSSVVTRAHHPVVHVSWNDARAFCAWSGTRLPTEAEWEYAARGGLDRAVYPWGDELTPDGEHRCNIWQGQFPVTDTAEDGYAGTAPANAYRPNGYGLYNVVGNVWEWCEDRFSPAYHAETGDENPVRTGPGEGRSMRGGSFLCHESYCNRYRVAARNSNEPGSSASNIGFRVVSGDAPH